MFESINPHTLEAIATYKAMQPDEVTEALRRSEKAFSTWCSMPLSEKTQLAEKLAEVLEQHKTDLAHLATLEMGKPITQAEAEVEKCAWMCRHYAAHAAMYLATEAIATDASRSEVVLEPLGGILGVMPWNFPYWQVLRFAVPTLLAGNTVVVKHASNVQGCALRIEELLAEAGFPKGVYTNLCISSDQVAAVIAHPHIKAVSLTGSEKAGAAVAKAAGRVLKKSLLELGGSNAFIVLADADLDHAAELGVRARMQNNGQSCIAAKRFIVHANVAEAFTQKLLKEMENLKTGNPLDRDVYLGPLARVDLAEELHRQVTRSVKAGAEVLCGGTRTGAHYAPTLIAKVVPGMPAFDEETFGPVATVTTAESDEKAIFLANCSRFGLGATICSADTKRALALGRRLKDGAVFINEMVKSDPRLPFGGTGISGYGRELGAYGIREFVNVKTYYTA